MKVTIKKIGEAILIEFDSKPAELVELLKGLNPVLERAQVKSEQFGKELENKKTGKRAPTRKKAPARKVGKR